MPKGAKNVGKVAGKLKKKVSDVKHVPFIKMIIPAAAAMPAPPLGPQLAQRGIQIAAFCKEFNAATSEYKTKVPLRCQVNINVDRSFTINISKPSSTYYLKQASGMKKGAMRTGHEVAGKLTLKHIYEIAKVKEDDDGNQGKSLKEICQSLIGQCHGMGIEVVKSLDNYEYSTFLAQRQEVVRQQEKELEEKRQAKLLRL